MNTEGLTGLILLIVAILLALWKRSGGGTIFPQFGVTGGGSSSASDTAEIDNPPVDLDYSLQNAPSQVARWAGAVQANSNLFDLPWPIVLAQVWQESYGNENAIGSAGEIGLMQLKEIAIRDLRQNGYIVSEDWDTSGLANIRAGAGFLDLQRKRTGNIRHALEAYNQGGAGRKRRPALAQKYANEVIEKARQLGWNG